MRKARIQCGPVSGIVAGKQYIGGLAGRAQDGTVIRDCSATVALDGTVKSTPMVIKQPLPQPQQPVNPQP